MKKIMIDRKDRNTDIGKHLITIFGKILERKPNIIVELGVRRGVSTGILAKAADMSNSRLVSVDVRDCNESCDWDKWEFIQADSVDFAEEFYKTGECIDVLFIDTYHSKPQVMKELGAWEKNTNDDCLFIFHDTNPVWHKNVGIADSIGSILDGVNEFFDMKLQKNGNYDTVLYTDKYLYSITHHDYFEGMTYIRRMRR